MTPTELAQKLAQYEDADTAIAVYKEANFIISQLEEVKRAALNLAESELRATGETGRKTAAGSCGWTIPKTRQLDKDTWQSALVEDTNLTTIQVNFDRAKATLEKAQEPFMRLPEERFFIK